MKETISTSYNIDMRNEGLNRYHLLKRKDKTGSYYIAAFPVPGGKGYLQCTTLHDAAGRKIGNIAKARQAASQIVMARTIKKQKAQEIETFYRDFWKVDSDYFKAKKDEGTETTPSYIIQSERLLEHYFFPWCRDNKIVMIQQLTRSKLMDWRAWLQNLLKEKGLLSSTTNKVRLAISVPLNYLVETEKLESNPISKVKNVKEESRPKNAFTESQLKKMLSIPWQEEKSRIACFLSASTGARIGEICGLRWANVRLDEGRLDIIEQFQQDNGEGMKKPKWNSVRKDVPLNASLISLLRGLKESYPNSTYVFPGRLENTPCRRWDLNRSLFKAMKDCGIEKTGLSWHSLRHYFISNLVASVGSDLASQAVGHKDIRTTNGYTHPTEKGDARIIDATAKFSSLSA